MRELSSVRWQDVVQIAGVHDPDEARLLWSAGVDLIGIPLRLPVHVEDLSDQEASRVVETLPPHVHPVLITYLERASDIAELCRMIRTSIVQLHGSLPVEEVSRLRDRVPGLSVIKSLIVRGSYDPTLDDEVSIFSPFVDAFITDTFDPRTGATGATGLVHDWEVSRRIVGRSARPVILAGGLTPENVGDAIRRVRPAGVDAHTGVEGPDGRKSMALVQSFVARAKAAFNEIRR